MADTVTNLELEALKVHQVAYSNSIARLVAMPDADKRANTIRDERKALAEVEARIKELEAPAKQSQPATQ